MKKILIQLSFIAFLLLTSLSPVWSQPHPAPVLPPEHGSDADQPAAGAPVGGGTLLLLGMAALYGGRKIYALRSSEDAE